MVSIYVTIHQHVDAETVIRLSAESGFSGKELDCENLHVALGCLQIIGCLDILALLRLRYRGCTANRVVKLLIVLTLARHPQSMDRHLQGNPSLLPGEAEER